MFLLFIIRGFCIELFIPSVHIYKEYIATMMLQCDYLSIVQQTFVVAQLVHLLQPTLVFEEILYFPIPLYRSSTIKKYIESK